MLSSASSKFDLLPARPPTPPREISKAVDDAISFLDDSNEIDRLLNKTRTTAGSDSSPSSGIQFAPTSSAELDDTSNAARKVGFSPNLIYHQITQSEQPNSPSTSLEKKSLSVKNTKPLKSILKSAHVLRPPTPEDLETKLNCFSPEIPGSFAKMLQSVIHQLAGSSRSSRLDAYLALNGVLKTYDKIPDLEALKQKMDQFMQFLTRDMAWKNSEGRLDVNIITQALKLTYLIITHTKLADSLDDDFKSFLLDRTILVLEQAEMSKAVIKPHMYILAQQRFRPTLVATGRVEKLVTALKTIEERCSGNTVIGTRLMIYRRLFEQAPNIMLARIRDWLEHIFHGMLSSVKDVRSRAIDTCANAGFTFGKQPHAGKAIHDLFETEVEEGQTYGDFLVMRLEEMMEDKEVAACVPQIWSSVILFIRSKRMPLERWSTFKLWLRLIQKCHNSSDINIRYQALIAWNKLVFAIMPDSSTSPPLMTMLKIPITSGIEKKGSDKYSQQVRQYALDSYYNLLYYAFRPGLSEAEHDTAWDTFVTPVLSGMIKSNVKGQETTCRAIQGLVKGDVDVWESDDAYYEEPVGPANLPKLGPKWVRSRLVKMLKLIEPIMATDLRSSTGANEALNKVWQDLMQSVADAGNQEVRTSNDLKEAIALLVNMFRRLWLGYTKLAGVNDDILLQRYVSLVDKMIETLGAGHFSEDILRQTDSDAVEVAPTPSHRHAKSHGEAQSPFVILFRMFCHPDGTLFDKGNYYLAVSKILNRFKSSKTGLQARLEVLSRCSNVLSQETSSAVVDSDLKRTLLAATTNNATAVLRSEQLSTSNNGHESQTLGHGLRHATDILISGLNVVTGGDDVDEILKLYDAICDTAKSSAGDGGAVIALAEPFAKALSSGTVVSLKVELDLTSHVLRKNVWPRSRQSMDQARKALWGVGLATNRSDTFDPFEHVYVLIKSCMVAAYDNLNTLGTVDLSPAPAFFSCVIGFLQRSPPSLLGSALRKIQEGFCFWVQDESRKTGDDEDILEIIRTIWTGIIHLLETLPNKDSTLLRAFEPLLIAGLSSPHKEIVNTTILFWNETFGEQQSLEYPAKLEKVLRARVVDAEICLPTFPDTNEESIPASLPEFFESQSQLPQKKDTKHLQTRDATHLSASQPSSRSPFFAARKSPLAQRVSISSPARRRTPKSASTTPKPRLRHDDSQIQFAPIDSSPLPPVGESQHLTEHQKEVLDRQHLNAQLFPDLSSSPLAQSTALPVSKRLDFSSNVKVHVADDAPGTPNGLPDGHGLMSDDLPSSPTPSSTKDVSQGAVDDDEDDNFDDAQQDPPSSPPRGNIEDGPHIDEDQHTDDEIVVAGTAIQVTDFAAADEEQPGLHEEPQDSENIVVSSPVRPPDATNVPSDLPSDTQLPTIQLQLEEAAASSKAKTIANSDEDAQVQTANAQPSVSMDEDVTRVENSFIAPDAADTEIDSQSTGGSQRSQRGSNKRRRSKAHTHLAKRHKSSSLQRQSSSYIEQDDDEDIGEEIVVASSQRSSSPVAYTASPGPSPEKRPEPVEEEIATVNNDSQASDMAPPTKRGRGRPKKQSTSLKRKASDLSDADASTPAESPVSSSFVSGTPTKSLKRRRRNDEEITRASHAPEAAEPLNQAKHKKSPAVVIQTRKRKAPSDQSTSQANGANEDMNTPNLQLQVESSAIAPAAPATPASARQVDRPILTPKSILRRLKDALTDFKGMILGEREEREFDDVLFEFRREVHEAGRRV